MDEHNPSSGKRKERKMPGLPELLRAEIDDYLYQLGVWKASATRFQSSYSGERITEVPGRTSNGRWSLSRAGHVTVQWVLAVLLLVPGCAGPPPTERRFSVGRGLPPHITKISGIIYSSDAYGQHAEQSLVCITWNVLALVTEQDLKSMDQMRAVEVEAALFGSWSQAVRVFLGDVGLGGSSRIPATPGQVQEGLLQPQVVLPSGRMIPWSGSKGLPEVSCFYFDTSRQPYLALEVEIARTDGQIVRSEVVITK